MKMSLIVEGGTALNLPKMFPVKQVFNAPKVNDLQTVIKSELEKECIRRRIKTGDRVAVAVGSRGIAGIAKIVNYLISVLRDWGAEPFIIPSMGSHGGATAEGQKKVLADLGISEDTMGVPIISSMDVVEIGRLACGMPVYLDQSASTADAIIVVNRIKPHTSFKGEYESGLLKMMAIGLGRHKGAATIHQRPLSDMPKLLPALAEVFLAKAPIAFGLGILENAYDETAEIMAIPAEELIQQEKQLLVKAKQYMPRLIPSKIDVLLVSEIGKNISGTGMDPNITGRAASKAPQTFNAPPIERIVVMGLTAETKGNACGMGTADVITKRVHDQINLDYTYANVITSKNLDAAKIPLIAPNDQIAISLALKTCYQADLHRPRMVLIKNTLELETIWVSEAILSEVGENPMMEITGDPVEVTFDSEGNMSSFFSI
jgi:hypothetical protein